MPDASTFDAAEPEADPEPTKPKPKKAKVSDVEETVEQRVRRLRDAQVANTR